jgi:hypothetical protein
MLIIDLYQTGGRSILANNCPLDYICIYFHAASGVCVRVLLFVTNCRVDLLVRVHRQLSALATHHRAYWWRRLRGLDPIRSSMSESGMLDGRTWILFPLFDRLIKLALSRCHKSMCSLRRCCNYCPYDCTYNSRGSKCGSGRRYLVRAGELDVAQIHAPCLRDADS